MTKARQQDFIEVKKTPKTLKRISGQDPAIF